MILHNESFMQSMNNHSITFIAHHQHCKNSNIVFFVFSGGPRDRIQKMESFGVLGFEETFRGLCNLWTHPRSLAIICTQHSLQQNMKKCKFHRVDFGVSGSQRQGGPKNGPSPSLLNLRSLERFMQCIHNKLCINFEHNIKFVIKSLTWRSVVFEF